MASYEIKSDGLCVIIADGSFRNQMMYNRVCNTVAKVETPKWINEEPIGHRKLIDKVNEILKDKAYIEYSTSYSRFCVNRYYSSYIFFCSEADAVAFKLRWM